MRVTGTPSLSMVPEVSVPEPEPGPTEKSETFEGSVSRNELERYEVTLGQNAKDVVVTMTGEGGDADLYTRFGGEPQTSGRDAYDCRPYKNGSNETCKHAEPTDSKLYIMVRGYARANSPFKVVVSWTE